MRSIQLMQNHLALISPEVKWSNRRTYHIMHEKFCCKKHQTHKKRATPDQRVSSLFVRLQIWKDWAFAPPTLARGLHSSGTQHNRAPRMQPAQETECGPHAPIKQVYLIGHTLLIRQQKRSNTPNRFKQQPVRSHLLETVTDLI